MCQVFLGERPTQVNRLPISPRPKAGTEGLLVGWFWTVRWSWAPYRGKHINSKEAFKLPRWTVLPDDPPDSEGPMDALWLRF